MGLFNAWYNTGGHWWPRLVVWVPMCVVAVGMLPLEAQAQPAEWTTSQWNGSTCNGCHVPQSNPPVTLLYPTPQEAAQSAAPNLNRPDDFLNYIRTAKFVAGSSAMSAFSSSATPAQRESIRYYLLSLSGTNVGPVARVTVNSSNVAVNSTVTLSGSDSTDVNNNIAADGYRWLVTRVGFLGSTTLAATGPSAAYTPTQIGTYDIALRVTDSVGATSAATAASVVRITVVAANVAPVANAGLDQPGVTLSSTVALDGRGSTDANSNIVDYTWRIVRPDTSVLNLSGATQSFTAAAVGTYNVRLTVTDAGGLSSFDDMEVRVVAANVPPVANAGLARTVNRGETVTMDGSASSDSDGSVTAYVWSLVARPAGSAATLTNATSAQANFVADQAGSFDVQLIVRDNVGASSSASVVRITSNGPPTANAGNAQNVTVGGVVSLNGTGSSDPNGDALTYAWTLSAPSGSAAVLNSTTSATPSFTADVAGAYTATLTVRDGRLDSAPANVVVTAAVGNATPVADAGPNQSVALNANVQLNGTASRDGNSDALTYLWTLTTRPAGSAATLSSTTDPQPRFVADVAGTYQATLLVNDGTVSSNVATVTISVATPTPVFAVSSTNMDLAAALGASNTASVVVSNTGAAPLTLNTLAFGGAMATEFTLDSSNACTPSLVLTPTTSCTLVVRFVPTSTGLREAGLSITHTAPGSPSAITLRGTATAAAQARIETSALSVAFGDAQVGSSAQREVTVRNAGDAALTLSSIGVTGAAASDYTRAGTCDVTAALAVGATCTLSLTFRPSATGTRDALLVINSNASNGSVTVALSGAGVALPLPQLTLSPTSVDFGSQSVAGVFAARSVRISNSGTANLTVTNITLTGSEFAALPSGCDVPLPPGGSCEVAVRFNATAADMDFAQTLRVESNASGSPHTATLRGRGVAAAMASLAWSTGSVPLPFGEVSVGSLSSAQTFTLTNQGPGGATFSLINTTGADASQFTVTGGTCRAGAALLQGETCTLEVRFAPALAGNRIAVLQVVSSGTGLPPLMLQGTGLGGPAASLALSRDTVAFSTVRVGAQSLPQEIVLRSDGSSPLQVLKMEVTGPFVVQSTTCPTAMPFTLPAGSQCAVTVAYQPQTEGTTAGSLRITTDGTPATRDIVLTGQATAAVDVSSGGCSVATGRAPFDPVLWLMTLLAAGVLGWRARRRGRGDA
jgi:trimeric autotransporter adhesin